jgi:hypothetical protein
MYVIIELLMWVEMLHTAYLSRCSRKSTLVMPAVQQNVLSKSSVQCINSIKNRCHRVPSAKSVEASATPPSSQHDGGNQQQRARRTNFMKLKLSKAQTWRYTTVDTVKNMTKSEIQCFKPQFGEDDDGFTPLTALARAIKGGCCLLIREIQRYGFRCVGT